MGVTRNKCDKIKGYESIGDKNEHNRRNGDKTRVSQVTVTKVRGDRSNGNKNERRKTQTQESTKTTISRSKKNGYQNRRNNDKNEYDKRVTKMREAKSNCDCRLTEAAVRQKMTITK